MPRHSHYDHVGAFHHLGETFVPSTVTFMDVRAGTSVIARPAKSDAVSDLQKMLNALKFRDARGRALVVDKLFGANTEAALKAAQAAIRAKLPSATMIDGTLDKTTLAALEALQAGQVLTEVNVPAIQMPEGGGLRAGSGSWWKNPWVLGAGTLAIVGAVVVMGSDDKKKA